MRKGSWCNVGPADDAAKLLPDVSAQVQLALKICWGSWNLPRSRSRLRVRRGQTYPFIRFPAVSTRHIFCRVAERQVTQLVALVKHMVAHSDVDDGGQQNAHPNGYVVGEDAQRVVCIIDPAPQLFMSPCQQTQTTFSSRSCNRRVQMVRCGRGGLLSRFRIFVRSYWAGAPAEQWQGALAPQNR